MSKSQGQPDQASAPGKEERHQTTREHAPTDQEREERIRRRAYQLWEESGRQDGNAEDYWHRAAQDLDREDADLQRSGSAGKSVAQNRA